MKHSLGLLTLACLAACASSDVDAANLEPAPAAAPGNINLGAFSVSLNVKDIPTSRTFYEALGFEATMGEPGGNWLIMRNGDHVIGLFQGLFERNTLTFNPGWNQAAEGVESFTDIREIQRKLEDAGLTLMARADESTTGPASVILADPDGNPIFLDQHVPAPGQ